MIVSQPFEELVERLEREAAEGFFHTAAQVVVSVAGESVLDVAVGSTHLHEAFEQRTLSALYCTSKPIVAVGVLRLVEEGELSLDDQMGHVVDGLADSWMAERTVDEVLGHTAGLHVVNTVLARILPEQSRETWLNIMAPPDGWRYGIDRSYAEFGGWYLLGKLIENLSDMEFDQFLQQRVLEPYGVDPADLTMRFNSETYEENVERISATFDLTLHQPVPLLAEVGRETACEWNPAFGAYGTMQQIAKFYEGLLADLGGAGAVLSPDLLGEATSPRLPLTYDETLDREAGFGLGFMAPLFSHFYGKAPSETAFGHAGQGGTSFAMADPENELVMAVLFNAGLDADTALSYRRVNVVDAIYRAVAAET